MLVCRVSLQLLLPGNETTSKKSYDNVTHYFLRISTKQSLQLLLSHSRLPHRLLSNAGILWSGCCCQSCWTQSQRPRFLRVIKSGIAHSHCSDCVASQMHNKLIPPYYLLSSPTAYCVGMQALKPRHFPSVLTEIGNNSNWKNE